MDEFSILMSMNNYDVVTISETWLDNSIENVNLALDDYNLYRFDRDRPVLYGKKKVGGLCVYVKQDIYVNDTHYAYLNTSEEFIEIQILKVRKGNDKESVIINTYRPPNGNTERFLEFATYVLEIVSTERYSDIYFIGDINIDHIGNRKVTRDLESVMRSFGMVQHITKPSRKTLSTESLIDICYIRTEKKILSFVEKNSDK